MSDDVLNKLDNLSDEDFAKMSEEELLELAKDDEESNEDNTGDDTGDNSTTDDNSDTSTDTDTSNDTDNNSDNTDDSTDTGNTDSEEEEPKEPAETSEDEDGEDSKDSNEDNEDTSKSLTLEEALAPLKYKGTKVTIESVDELRQLASKGLDYSNKTAELANDRRYIATLRENGLLDEEALSLLIEAKKGNKDAIYALMKGAGISPEDLPFEEEDTTFQPDNHVVPASEMQVKETLDYIANNNSKETYEQLFDIVDNQMDKVSQDFVIQHPDNLKVLADHMDKGYFQVIYAEMQKRSALGTLPNAPFVDVYKAVGSELEQKGVFANQQAKPPKQVKQNTDKLKKVLNPSKSSSKRPTKGYSLADLDDMSDEEFLKQFENIKLT